MEIKEIRDIFWNLSNNWDLAARNIKGLEEVKKKPFQVGELRGYVQYNPSRSVSTLAKLDKDSVRKRKCFLCSCNRAKEQNGIEILPDWELLINPYPILPYHFTIVSKNHIPQEFIPEIGYKLTEELEGMIVFFNAAGAGASAPDHMHFQAVPMGLLPVIDLVDSNWERSVILDIPFKIFTDLNDYEKYNLPVNAFFWKAKNGDQRFLAIPRLTHRPDLFFKEPPLRRAFSPGAIDMTGILVTPYEEDFYAITDTEIDNIYRQVALSNDYREGK